VQYLQHGARAAEEFALDGLAGDARFQALIADRPIETIHSLEPSLEEVFIAVTGRELA
jgi:fluoroquinolone transport system ATP-binding protein